MITSSYYNVHIDEFSIFEIVFVILNSYRNFRFLGLFSRRTKEIARICSVAKSLRRGGTTKGGGSGDENVTPRLETKDGKAWGLGFKTTIIAKYQNIDY